jgi:hypothetical protein
MSESIPVACKCGAHMGRMVQVDEEIYLDDGVMLVSAGRKICHVCGRPFHFRRPQRSWRSLMQQSQQVAMGVGG